MNTHALGHVEMDTTQTPSDVSFLEFLHAALKRLSPHSSVNLKHLLLNVLYHLLGHL
jgi:hypothetical protein